MSASQAIAPHSTASDQPASEPEGYRYHLLRTATARFQRNIPALSRDELAEAQRQAQRSFALEEQVLNSAEARAVLIPDTQLLQRSYQAVKQRYDSQHELEADLERNGLDSRQLRQALRRELIFDTVMQRVGARHAPITDADERLFYELHRERFDTPETRSARHILITINDDYPENRRAVARARIEAIGERLRAQANDPAALLDAFIDEARKGSECPTAMEGGQLGTLSPGQLYPALDAALFELETSQLSGVLESELGFHLLLCEAIHPAKTLPFEQVRARIHQALEQRRRKERQRQWLASLTA
ncbi:nitrogen fixation protein NifM [Halochromatium salexigens]|uniref:peptidylprolyl isomerase n=1 Tax=Halochromatium salexigens TaxID=49447 RepID=A0AAJ0UI79_HALSE|nr:nitrogen fixation protein NifM [Halochromatium salexigens]MBK5931992.1 nitrogen fixation protein NifM [Halochromatium salexigens]